MEPSSATPVGGVARRTDDATDPGVGSNCSADSTSNQFGGGSRGAGRSGFV